MSFLFNDFKEEAGEGEKNDDWIKITVAPGRGKQQTTTEEINERRE